MKMMWPAFAAACVTMVAVVSGFCYINPPNLPILDLDSPDEMPSDLGCTIFDKSVETGGTIEHDCVRCTCSGFNGSNCCGYGYKAGAFAGPEGMKMVINDDCSFDWVPI